jgi:hypothetical protein
LAFFIRSYFLTADFQLFEKTKILLNSDFGYVLPEKITPVRQMAWPVGRDENKVK